ATPRQDMAARPRDGTGHRLRYDHSTKSLMKPGNSSHMRSSSWRRGGGSGCQASAARMVLGLSHSIRKSKRLGEMAKVVDTSRRRYSRCSLGRLGQMCWRRWMMSSGDASGVPSTLRMASASWWTELRLVGGRNGTTTPAPAPASTSFAICSLDPLLPHPEVCVQSPPTFRSFRCGVGQRRGFYKITSVRCNNFLHQIPTLPNARFDRERHVAAADADGGSHDLHLAVTPHFCVVLRYF